VQRELKSYQEAQHDEAGCGGRSSCGVPYPFKWAIKGPGKNGDGDEGPRWTLRRGARLWLPLPPPDSSWLPLTAWPSRLHTSFWRQSSQVKILGPIEHLPCLLNSNKPLKLLDIKYSVGTFVPSDGFIYCEEIVFWTLWFSRWCTMVKSSRIQI